MSIGGWRDQPARPRRPPRTPKEAQTPPGYPALPQLSTEQNEALVKQSAAVGEYNKLAKEGMSVWDNIHQRSVLASHSVASAESGTSVKVAE